MKLFIVLIFIFSAILFIGTVNNYLKWRRPGVYPPKRVLKRRVNLFAGGGLICFIIGAVLSYFN